MSTDLILPVRPTQIIQFDPTTLLIRALSSSPLEQNQPCYYELKEAASLKPGMTSREWTDKGNVAMPKVALMMLRDETTGKLNVAVANQLLAPFNLEIDEVVLEEMENPTLPTPPTQP